MKFQTGTGAVLKAREVYALADRGRHIAGRMEYAYGAYRDEHDGTITWYFHQGEWTADSMAAAEATYQQDRWWDAHKRDVTVIPSLSDSDLKLFRLLADIRADLPVLNATTTELRHRGIHDYPIAI